MLIVTVILFFSHRIIKYLNPFTFFFVNERAFWCKLHLHYFVQTD